MGAENLIIASKPPELVVNVVKELKGSKIIFNDVTKNLYFRGISDIKIEGDIITIYRAVLNARVSVDFTLGTLDKFGTTTPQELVEHWQLNNFFFESTTPLVSDDQIVNTFADLPLASTVPGQLYFVRTQTGVWLINTRKQSGFYLSDGAVWTLANDPLQYFIDDTLAFKDNADLTKTLQFQLDQISTATNRLATWPDFSGLVAIIGNFGFSDLLEKNEGQVKLNDGNSLQPTFNWNGGIPPGTAQQIIYASPLGFSGSPITQFPENISSPADSDLYDFVNDTFIENTVLGQSNFWRINLSYSGKAANVASGIEIVIENTLSGFIEEKIVTLPRIVTSGNASVTLITIADEFSLPSPIGTGQGYEISLNSTDDITVVVESITRFNYQKNPRP